MFAADILSVTDKFCKEPLALPLMFPLALIWVVAAVPSWIVCLYHHQ